MSANLGRVQAFDDSMPVKAERLDIMFRNLLTAKQVVWVYAFAGITKDRLPKKGETVVFPSPIQSNVSFVVRLTFEPAIYGGKLYEVLHDTL